MEKKSKRVLPTTLITQCKGSEEHLAPQHEDLLTQTIWVCILVLLCDHHTVIRVIYASVSSKASSLPWAAVWLMQVIGETQQLKVGLGEVLRVFKIIYLAPTVFLSC